MKIKKYNMATYQETQQNLHNYIKWRGLTIIKKDYIPLYFEISKAKSDELISHLSSDQPLILEGDEYYILEHLNKSWEETKKRKFW